MGLGIGRILNWPFQRTTGHNWDPALGRLLFKCDTPFTDCISGTLKRRKSKRSFDKTVLVGADPWESKQHLQFENIYDKDILDEIYSKYQQYITDDSCTIVKKSNYYGFEDALFCRRVTAISDALTEGFRQANRELDAVWRYGIAQTACLDVSRPCQTAR